jgi:hypothetical protein
VYNAGTTIQGAVASAAALIAVVEGGGGNT